MFATGWLCVSVNILCLCGVMAVDETASRRLGSFAPPRDRGFAVLGGSRHEFSRLRKNVGVVQGAWFEVQGQQAILDSARSVPSNREPSTLNLLGVFQHPVRWCATRLSETAPST